MADKKINEKKIKIKIDVVKKGVTDIIIPEEINPVEAVLILNTVQNILLQKISVEPAEKKSNLILTDHKIVGA